MEKYRGILFLCLFSAYSLLSGDEVNITGTVVDKITGLPVQGALVTIQDHDEIQGVNTDADGDFAISGAITGITAAFHHSISTVPVLRKGILTFPVFSDQQPVTIEVYTLQGMRIREIPAVCLNKGTQSVRIFPHNSPSYFCVVRIRQGSVSSVHKFVALHGSCGRQSGAASVSSALPFTAGVMKKGPLAVLEISKGNYITAAVDIDTLICALGTIQLAPADYKWKSAKVFEWDKYDGNPSSLVSAAENAGMNVIQVMDRYFTQGASGNDQLVSLANQRGIKVFVIFQTFYNDDAIINAANSALDMDGNPVHESWLTFICPNESGYKSQRLNEIVSLVNDIRPDGVSMDFFRYYVYWEAGGSGIQTCFCSRCLTKFDDQYGITASPSEIVSDHLDEWTEFKCRTIADYAAEILAAIQAIKPDIMMNLHLVPWKESDYNGAQRVIAAQDLSLLSQYFDMIQPMTYSSMMGQSINWIYEVASDAKSQVGQNVYVVPCIETANASSTNLDLISQDPVDGFSIWPFEDY